MRKHCHSKHTRTRPSRSSSLKRIPRHFVDRNHKPEIAVSIGEPLSDSGWGKGIAFTGFVGFQPLDKICNDLKAVLELRQAIGDDRLVEEFISEPSKESLRALYAALLSRDQDSIRTCIDTLLKRVAAGDWLTDDESKETGMLLQKINGQYPGDVGILSTTFFMNLLKLKRGEAVYIGADEIHAYLEGDIIECMAVSDNVLNVAFVPPDERQTTDFVRALTFTSREGDFWRLGHSAYKRSKHGKKQAYEPPLEEFVVLGTALKKGEKEVLSAVEGPTVGIVLKGATRVTAGASMILQEGSIVFVAPTNRIHIEAIGAEGNEMWWATVSAD